MLLDIFARRYEASKFRDVFEQRDHRLLVQAFRILKEDLYPQFVDRKESAPNVTIWKNLESGLSRELGLTELAPHAYAYRNNGALVSGLHSIVTVCENWVMMPVSGSADEHIKDRLSLIELGFREKGEELGRLSSSSISEVEASLANLIAGRRPVDKAFLDAARSRRTERTDAFRKAADELNARFRQAGYGLHYHNGFIQLSTDDLMQSELETPFWALVAGPDWHNVDRDMKEALDLRDSGGRDPAFYAARALESAIKIICTSRQWHDRREKGAQNYIDKLASNANGFITQWEADALRSFFTHVRNPISHGPGSKEFISLSQPQTEWAIEFSMSWIKNLLRRL